MKKGVITFWLKKYVSYFGKVLSYVIPPILSYGIAGVIKFFFSLDNWVFILCLIIITLLLGVVFQKINLIIDENTYITKHVISVLEKDLGKYSQELSGRQARSFPDTPMVNIKNYLAAITSIQNKGYLEFADCWVMGLEAKSFTGDLFLHTVSPGMHKFFMVLLPTWGSMKDGYIRLSVPDGLGIDERDFTETWFNHIFPILGNLTKSVSEKLSDGDGYGSELSNEYFIIHDYIFIRHRENKIVSLRIYI